MASLPENLDIENNFGFAKKVVVSEATGSRNIYMSVDKMAGFSRAQNLNMQLCPPGSPLPVLFDIKEPLQGNPSRWGLDVEVPIDTPLYRFLVELNAKARTEISSRAAECFPSLKVDKMSEDQLNMCMYPVFKPAEDGGQTGRLKIKVIMPASDDELAHMSKGDAERRANEATKVFAVTDFQAPNESNPDGVFEHEPADPSILKGGCKVMPIISTTGIWMNKSNCGISFICTSVCVWKAPENSGVNVFNLGGVTPSGIKRKRVKEDEDEPSNEIGDDAGSYSPYHESPAKVAATVEVQ